MRLPKSPGTLKSALAGVVKRNKLPKGMPDILSNTVMELMVAKLQTGNPWDLRARIRRISEF